MIRVATIQDAAAFFRMRLALDEETDCMLWAPGERGGSVEQTEAFLRQMQESDSLVLVVVEGGELVGFLEADRGPAGRTRHTVYVVLGLRAAYRGRGLGRALLRELDAWACTRGVQRLELTVLCRNLRAVRLYTACGYVVEGLRRRSFCCGGVYEDEYYMAKLLV